MVKPDFSVDEAATTELRATMKDQRGQIDGSKAASYNKGGTVSELIANCEKETGLKPPTPQWERNPYGPHAGLPYVKKWYEKMREQGMKVWDEQ